jgi:hypothetical protein
MYWEAHYDQPISIHPPKLTQLQFIILTYYQNIFSKIAIGKNQFRVFFSKGNIVE